MKRFIKIAVMLVVLMVMAMQGSAQIPTYSCVATADTLMTSKIYQFDIYIYRTGSTLLYLNNYQLSFNISNSAGILNGGTITGAYVAGSSGLPTAFLPGGVSIFNIAGTIYMRVNGCTSSSNGTLIPTTGLKIGSFRFTNTNDYGQINPNTICWDASPALTYLYAIVPPAPTGTVMEISDNASHTTAFTDPIFNAPVIAYNMTGTGSYCSGGLPVGLDGSQTGVMYRLIKNGSPVGSYIPGTGSTLSFGTQTEGTYTATAYRKATYLSNNMNGSAVVTHSTINPTITGNNTVCLASSGNVYTTQTGMTNYIWAVSPGGTITSGGGSGNSSVTIAWNTAGAQWVSVNYTNSAGCTSGAPVVFNVTVNPLPVPTISGPTNNVCAGSGYNTYSTQTGNTNYVWTISSGGSIITGQGSSQVDVFWNAPGPQWIAITYTNAAGCSPAAPVQLNMDILTTPGPAGSITGNSSVCAGASSVPYSVPPISNTLYYVWTLPSGATIASGAGTNNITVNFAPNAVSGNITVYGNNFCGNGSTSPPFAVTINPYPAAAGSITGKTAVCQGTTGLVYSVEAIANATGYVWSLPPGVIIVGGANTNSITVDFTSSARSGNFQVYGTNSCGNGTISPPLYVFVSIKPPTPGIGGSAAKETARIGDTLTSTVTEGLQWLLNGQVIPGATNSYFVIKSAGSYSAVTYLGTCCSDTSNIIEVGSNGISSRDNARFVIYPVPNNGLFTASISSGYDESYRIEIFNTLGAMVHKTKVFRVQGKHDEIIDVRFLPAGIYTVVFVNDQTKVVKKIFINN